MGWYSDECLRITDMFEEELSDLEDKKECLLSMKKVYNEMAREVQELEKKLKWEDSEELKELKEANLINKKRNSR
tara:strand:- start:121 stop:345 length:225 start_codon:yes stop_codon:yes gene_type:complete